MVATLAIATTLAGCSSDTEGRHELVVLAASSLTDAFVDIATAFEAANPDVEVTLSFGGSSALATQVREGSPADVFAAADDKLIAELAADGLSDAPAPFATNSLAIVVEKGNPKRITSLSDLARGDLVVLLCEVDVPCGRLADQVLAAADVAVTPASREPNVKSVVSKVALGEADAGLAYVTDTRAATATVDEVSIPATENGINHYTIARLRDGDESATDFVAFVLSSAGQRILTRYGFGVP